MGNSSGKPLVLTDEVNLNHFRLLRVVGKGAFGKVRIVERKDTGLTFALKYIRKDEVVRSESVRNIIRERRMLQHLNHPFLCNLRYSFQDMEYLYIVVDLMNGGDLRFHISRKTFTEEAVRFWIAELACALRHIHKQGIVHRDVKPDNVLLDSEGHVHLADFNVASDFTPGKLLSSKSGTLAYLAPEVYAGRGYASEVDWWSLGVLFYECIYNRRPFEANNSDALANTIMKADPAYPVTQPQVSMVCLHAISSLLEKDKTLRIGAAGFESFTDNPFFREIDFEALERKEIEPVFCPSSDKTNFDATYDLEELLLEEAPLEARARKQKPRAELREDATAQEIRADELHRMIETMFEPFNYTQMPAERAPLTDAAVAASSTSASAQQGTPHPGKKYAKSERDAPTEPSRARKPPENTRSIPTPRSQTPGSTSRTRSSIHSPNGSPPLPPATLTTNSTAPLSTSPPNGDYKSSPIIEKDVPPLPPQVAAPPAPGQPSQVRSIRYDEITTNLPPPTTSAPRQHRPRGSHRSTSSGGGVQVVLNEQGSWSGMANQSAAMVEGERAANEKPTGMLGFLGRKKGRDRSPKAKPRERGVLGKEGARVVINPGDGERARSRARSNPLPAVTEVMRKVRSKGTLRDETEQDDSMPTTVTDRILRKTHSKQTLKGSSLPVDDMPLGVHRARSKSLPQQGDAVLGMPVKPLPKTIRKVPSRSSDRDGEQRDVLPTPHKVGSKPNIKEQVSREGMSTSDQQKVLRQQRPKPNLHIDVPEISPVVPPKELHKPRSKHTLRSGPVGEGTAANEAGLRPLMLPSIVKGQKAAQKEVVQTEDSPRSLRRPRSPQFFSSKATSEPQRSETQQSSRCGDRAEATTVGIQSPSLLQQVVRKVRSKPNLDAASPVPEPLTHETPVIRGARSKPLLLVQPPTPTYGQHWQPTSTPSSATSPTSQSLTLPLPISARRPPPPPPPTRTPRPKPPPPPPRTQPRAFQGEHWHATPTLQRPPSMPTTYLAPPTTTSRLKPLPPPPPAQTHTPTMRDWPTAPALQHPPPTPTTYHPPFTPTPRPNPLPPPRRTPQLYHSPPPIRQYNPSPPPPQETTTNSSSSDSTRPLLPQHRRPGAPARSAFPPHITDPPPVSAGYKAGKPFPPVPDGPHPPKLVVPTDPGRPKRELRGMGFL